MNDTWTPLKIITEVDTESLESQVERECPIGMLEYLKEEAKQTGVSFESLCEEELKCYREAKEAIKTLKPPKPIIELWKLESFRENMEINDDAGY